MQIILTDTGLTEEFATTYADRVFHCDRGRYIKGWWAWDERAQRWRQDPMLVRALIGDFVRDYARRLVDERGEPLIREIHRVQSARTRAAIFALASVERCLWGSPIHPSGSLIKRADATIIDGNKGCVVRAAPKAVKRTPRKVTRLRGGDAA